ncbi:uncharacterized protein LOC143474448 isoform X4 [Brachyhypopomus gauderio]|uniref:uncharacterized protein LOC143474448 isoform X4 n=1 Tax=Brachyhypopomus gauderio TaxID=698409 RepID=UPI004043058F
MRTLNRTEALPKRCSGNFMVTQTPPTVVIKAETSVQMSCCWDQIIDGPKVKWLKGTIELNLSDPRLQRENRTKSCTTLIITNTCKTDAGSYICEVTQDIPILRIVHGPGTNVKYQEENVLGRPDSDGVSSQTPPTKQGIELFPSDQVIITAIRCLPLLTLLIVVCYLNRFYRQLKLRAGCSGNFMVTQTPPTLVIMAGASVQMSCCWDQIIDGPKVKWLKDTVELNLSDPRLQRENRANLCTTLIITNTCKNDAGSYICEVTQDIPILRQVKGPGTNVTYQEENVLGRPDSDGVSSQTPPTKQGIELFPSDEVIITAIRCLPLLTLLIAVCYLNRLYKQLKLRAGTANIRKTEEGERGQEERDEPTEQERREEEMDEPTGQKRGMKMRAV